MGRPEIAASFGARARGRLDGVTGVASYLLFTSLDRHAPTFAEGIHRLGQLWRGRTWLVGYAETDEGPVDVAYLGRSDTVAHWLLDKVGVVALRTTVAKQTPGSVPCAVELVAVPKRDADRWSRAGWLLLPRYVRHRQALDESPSPFEERVARLARDKGLSTRFSREATELDRFHAELYDPMLERRHGPRALRSGRALLRLAQRRGGLMITEEGGRMVAGAVAAPSAAAPDELEIWALGVSGSAPTDAGLVPVLGWVRWARERRYAAVDHLASLPLYSDGLTRHKLRWGTELVLPKEARELVAMRVHGSGAPLASWLRRHSFAARSKGSITRVDVTEPGRLAEVARALSLE